MQQPSSHDVINRDIGRLEGRVAALNERVGSIETRTENTNAEVQRQLAAIQQELSRVSAVNGGSNGRKKQMDWRIGTGVGSASMGVVWGIVEGLKILMAG